MDVGRGRVHKVTFRMVHSTCYTSLQFSPNTAPANKPPMVAFIKSSLSLSLADKHAPAAKVPPAAPVCVCVCVCVLR